MNSSITTEPDNDDSVDSNVKKNPAYLFLQVILHKVWIAALLDTRTSVNLIPSDLFNEIPDKLKTSVHTQDKDFLSLVLDNNQKIDVLGTAPVNISVKSEVHKVFVYNILKCTSYSLVLGTKFLIDNKVVLYFSSLSEDATQTNVRSTYRISVPPKMS